MSASRANAAARNRRAGGAEMLPPQQQQQQQQFVRGGRPTNQSQSQRPTNQSQSQRATTQNEPPQNPKISISDAIGLVTLRLGRLETFMHTINHEGVPSFDNLDDNARIIDDNVFKNIVSRLDNIENKVSEYENKLQSIKSELISNFSSNSVQKIDSDNLFEKIKNSPFVNDMRDKQQAQQTSLYEVKDMILKLQSFYMETNSTLKGHIEQYETDKILFSQGDLNKEQYVDYEESEIVDDDNLTIDGNSLKELIKQELTKEMSQNI
jgi:regulator of replication initiation timing